MLLVFVDGLGIGEPGCHNPLSLGSFPGLERVCAGLPVSLAPGDSRVLGEAMLLSLDATFGVPGLPQSATGQTALLSGVRAPELVGRHVHAYPTKELSLMLQQSNILSLAAKSGLKATFLNAYTNLGPNGLPTRERLSCTTVANMAAGLRFRDLTDLAAGKAVYHDITGSSLQKRGYSTPVRSAEEAAVVATSIAQQHSLTLFEYFMTDVAGHGQQLSDCLSVLKTLDRFLAGVVQTADPAELLIIVTSDHGNIEDISTSSHTRNPVPLALYGMSVETKRNALRAKALSDVAEIVMRCIGGFTDGREHTQSS